MAEAEQQFQSSSFVERALPSFKAPVSRISENLTPHLAPLLRNVASSSGCKVTSIRNFARRVSKAWLAMTLREPRRARLLDPYLPSRPEAAEEWFSVFVEVVSASLLLHGLSLGFG